MGIFKSGGAEATAATQAQQEGGSLTDVFATPGRQQFHQSAVKGHCNLNGTGVIAFLTSYNVSGITDNGTGDYTVTWNNDFSSGDAYSYAFGQETEGTQNIGTYSTVRAAGSIRFTTYRRDSGAAIDVPSVSVIASGDFP